MTSPQIHEITSPRRDLFEILSVPVSNISPADAERIAMETFGVIGRARSLSGERAQNFHIVTQDEVEVVLKVTNALEPPEVLDLENQALIAAAATDPSLPIPRLLPTLAGGPIGQVGPAHNVRMMTFLPGEPLATQARSPALRRDVGRVSARLGQALRGFFHPAAGRALIWDLKQAGAVAELARYVDDAQQRVVDQVFEAFNDRIRPALPGLRAQVIHNDFNARNLLVDPAAPDRLAGVIDFGDTVHAPLIVDLAVAMAHQIRGETSPVEAAADVLAGYAAVTRLEEDEIDLLSDIVSTRIAMGIAIRSWRSKVNPDHAHYDPRLNTGAVTLLQSLRDIGRNELTACFRRAAGLQTTSARGIDPQILIERRPNVLGPGLRQFYDFPFYPVRGNGVWLYDTAGRRYLDAYNNVAHVGHCHPAVVAALSSQAATVNTNTRYLHHSILDYGERLTATMGSNLSVCLFTCTGTEANDLAWRLATAATRADGIIATRYAYHGNSTFVSALDGSIPANDALRWLARVPAPDVDQFDAAAYADAVDQAMMALRANGHAPAALIFDTTFASEGLHLPPAGYLTPALERLHNAGGLLIADEVQPGFGRLGTDMWGYQKLGITPDIVTIGKPAGNGHPIGIVVTTPAIVRAFFAQNRYFNTFGGNPVSCATGLAVLDVVQREHLQQNANETGAYLKQSLQGLAARHPWVGMVRGSGFFIGVDIVKDGVPAGAEARQAMNEMARRGVLIGITGPTKSLLKIRPPMVFDRSNADHLVSTLDSVLTAL